MSAMSFARVTILLAMAGVLQAQTPSHPPMVPPPEPAAVVDTTPGSELTVYLLTFGVGQQIWEKFGHNAIRIRDARTGTDSVYHWGLFDFSQPNFIGRFLKGQMLYSMGGFTFASTMADYHRLDRSVWSQELDLPPALRLELRRLIATNMQPGNREYAYDYYLDNCSTRVRDLLDRVIGGRMRSASSDTTERSYRWHTLRLTQMDFFTASGIHMGLGRPADRPITTWEEMFLPMTVHDMAKKVLVPVSYGGRVPLVRRESTLYQSSSFREPAEAPNWTVRYAIIGVVVAGLLLALGVAGIRRRGGVTIAASVAHSLVALVFGLVGLLITLLWAVTHHRFAHQNENLLLFNPLWLVLAVAAPYTLASGRAAWVRPLSFVVAGLAVVGLLLHPMGLSRQGNLDLFALVLPPALAFAAVMHLAARRRRT